MSTRSINTEDIAFKRMIITSVAFHVGVVIIFTIRAAFFPSEKIEYMPTMKVDIVGLPDKRDPEQKIIPESKPAPTASAVVETKPAAAKKEEKKTTEAKKTNTQDILDRFKKETKTQNILDRFKNEVANESKPAATTKPIAGNKVSEGTALRGLDKVEFDQYAGTVDAHIKNYWTLPEWMRTQNFNAVINVKFDRSGNVISKTFVKKSGNTEFDSYVEKAIESSNPFPAPPARLTDLVSIRGITFAFPE